MVNPLKKNFTLLIFSGIGLLLTLLNQIQVANYFGTSGQRDVYFLANTFIGVLYTINYRSVVMLFLPRYTKYLNSDFQKGVGQSFVWIYAVGIILFLLVLMVFLQYFFSSGLFPYKNVNQLFQILQLLLIGLVFQSVGSLQTVVYHAKNQFVFPASQNLFIILSIVFSVHFFHQHGIIVMAWGYLIGNILCFISLLIGRFQEFVHHLNFKYNLSASKSLFKEVLPYVLLALIGMVVHLIEPLFVLKEANGVISFLGYSYQIILILIAVVSATIVTTFYARISDLHTKNDLIQLRAVILQTVRVTFIFCVGVAGFIMLFGQEIISIVFVRGNFTEKDSSSIFRVLRWELVTFVFGSLNLLLNRFFYLTDNKKILFQAAFLSLGVYIATAYVLYLLLNYEGLGMALGIWSLVYFILLILNTIKTLDLKLSELISFALKAIFCVLATLLLISAINPYVTQQNDLVRLIIMGGLYISISFLSVRLSYKWLFGNSQ